MKYKWLNKKQNKKLIVFFNGWGMDEIVVNHLEFDDYDVLMFYDYNTLNVDFNLNELNIYPKKYLIAWSMGVMTATLFDIKYNSKTAINGTLKPIDDYYGIPEKIYNLTIKGFSPLSLKKFIKNMGLNPEVTSEINRDFENQKSELIALKGYKANKNYKYNRIVLSSEDKIIPTKNQSAFWQILPNVNSGHSPFNLFRKWSELL